VLRLLQKKPDDRHRDAYHLVQELQKVLDTLPAGTSSKPNIPAQHSSGPAHVDVRPEEEGWARTARLYKQMQTEVHPKNDPPDWLPETIAELERTIAEVRELRKQLEETAAKATEQQEQGRKPREQIGHALDELLQDDSRLGGQITEILAQLQPAESRLDAAMHAVLSGISNVPKQLRTGEVVTEHDAAALRELVRVGGELSLARDMVSSLRVRGQRKKAERRDLRFQIAQLKQNLEQVNHSSTMDMEIWHEEADRLSAAIQAKLESLAPLGQRISAHFGLFPELHERLARGADTSITLA
jgi:eukaryotic-like serine/threonine-protein kinase